MATQWTDPNGTDFRLRENGAIVFCVDGEDGYHPLINRYGNTVKVDGETGFAEYMNHHFEAQIN